MIHFFEQFKKEFLAVSFYEKCAFFITLASYVPLIMSAGDIVLLSFMYWIVLASVLVRVMKIHNLPYMMIFAYVLGDSIVCLVGLASGGTVTYYADKLQLYLLSAGFFFFLTTWLILEIKGKFGVWPLVANAIALQISYIPLIHDYSGPAEAFLGGIGLLIADVAMVVQLVWANRFIQKYAVNKKEALVENLIWLVGIANSSFVAVLMMN